MKKSFYIMAALFAAFALCCLADDNPNSDYTVKRERVEGKCVEDYSGFEPADTLYQRGAVMVCTDWAYLNDVEFSVLYEPVRIVTFQEGKPVRALRLESGLPWMASDEALLVDLGIDTLRLPWEHLPESIDEVPVEGYKFSSYRQYFRNCKDAEWSNYAFLALLPAEHAEWLDCFMLLVLEDLNEDGDGCTEETSPFAKYEQYLQLASAHSLSAATDKVLEKQREVAFDFSRSFFEGYGEDVEYWSYVKEYVVNPVWKSADGRLATYRFCFATKNGTSHGGYEDYYFTFDLQTGRIIGLQDLFTEEECEHCLTLLSRKVIDYRKQIGEFVPEELDNAPDWSCSGFFEKNLIAPPLTEVYKEGRFPFPALTDEGLLFNYQLYWIGGFAQGMASFVVPYNQVKMKLKP